MGDREQWYSNKELHEMLTEMRINFQHLSNEMKETRRIIKQYNGLYEKVDGVSEKVKNVDEEVKKIKSVTKGRSSAMQAIYQWGGWLFGLITLVILIYTTFN